MTIDSYYYHYYQGPFVLLIIHFYCVVKIQGFFFLFQSDFIKMSGYSRGEIFKKVRAGVQAHVAYMF